MEPGGKRQSANGSSEAFFFARVPMLLIGPDGTIVDVNAASRELFSLDLAGCRGRHYKQLLDQVAGRLEGTFLPLAGPATTRFSVHALSTSTAHRAAALETCELAVTMCDCRYVSERLGEITLRSSEIPSIDASSGLCVGSLVSFEIRDGIALKVFETGLNRRLSHEVMWEVYAASYDRILPELPFYREVVGRHERAMSKPEIDSVLDLGAGTGSVSVPLLQIGKQVTSVDINRAMLHKIESKIDSSWLDRLTIVEDTAERMPHLRDESFDGVTILLALFDMENPFAALSEAIRLLRPGGCLVMTEPRACFDVTQLMTAAERALVEQGLMERLSTDWDRIRSVAPLVRDAVDGAQNRRVRDRGKREWHAETIVSILQEQGFTELASEESHFGNCETIVGRKPC